MTLLSGERQVAPTIAGIRRDHVARYEWAAQRLGNDDRVLDCGCGVGYGSVMLAQTAQSVVGFDQDPDAIAYAEAHYRPWPNIYYGEATADNVGPIFLEDPGINIAVAFEIIEHLADPRPFLTALRRSCKTLLASVPNQTVFPFRSEYVYHHRHYTRAEFEDLLNRCGWKVDEWWGQHDVQASVERDVEGRTLVVRASPLSVAQVIPIRRGEPALPPKPLEHVAIIGLGPSAEAYMDHVKRLGSRQAFADEVWAVNALGSVLACDLVFHMDDVRIQEIRAAAKPESNIAAMLAWLKTTPVPVMTSFAHPDYPSLIEFPLEAVVNHLRRGYFNNTVPYAVAYAIYRGAKKISLFGCDYTYPDAHKAERGRACLEFWLGYAAAKGILIATPTNTSLMDAFDDTDDGDAPSYGYDAVKIRCDVQADGSMKLTMTPRDRLPTAEEIEAAYDHGKHPLAQSRPAAATQGPGK